jgi:PilZ domain-containing protein
MAHTNLKRGLELRRHRRYMVDAAFLQVSWLDRTGRMKTARTRALNVSETGIAIELPEAAMPLLIRFHSDKYNVKGMGSVRYCVRSGNKYVVGVEFGEDLRWQPPRDEVPEPIPLCDPRVN